LPLKPYDILIVNNYIANGLHPSGIDEFFEPLTEPPSIEEVKQPPPPPQSFQEIALGARQALKDLRDRKPMETVGESLVYDSILMRSWCSRHERPLLKRKESAQ
jgi:hypothetical protein